MVALNLLVVELFEEVESKAVLGVNDPDEEETILLDHVKRQVHDLLVIQRVVGDGNAASRVSRAQLPWRVDRNDVEKSASCLALLTR